MKNFRFGFLGGDLRYNYFYNMLIKDNYIVKSFNNKYISKNVHTLADLLKDTDILITPIPFTKNNKTIFNPNFEEININILLEKLKNSNINIIAGGVIPKEFIEQAKNINIKVLDFFDLESVAILNAIPTAEGAIQTAMQESDKTLFNSNCLVLGYGRCGKVLANALKGIGANVTATYRKSEDFSYIKSFGLNSLNLNDLKENINKFDFIFNTIPSCILNENILKQINKNAIIIDLAQAPGGVDYNFARTLNLNAIYCPGLPGRVAPFTAAKILKDALFDFI